MSEGFHIVDVCDEERPEHFVTYIQRSYRSYVEAVRERNELLDVYPEGHIWRKRLYIQHPDGSITNPEVPHDDDDRTRPT